VLSLNQWGFRPKRGTMQPLELLVSALEDAALFGQDLYLLMVDFSAAFDTIDHDKMLMIMYDLGFATDAIEVVRDLIRRRPHALQDARRAHRESCQSTGARSRGRAVPLLFALYLEPLLRWLQQGGRGYVPQVPHQRRGRLGADACEDQISSCTYADDLNVATETPERPGSSERKDITVRGVGRPRGEHDQVGGNGHPAPHRLWQADRRHPGEEPARRPPQIATPKGVVPVKIKAPKDPFVLLGVTLTMDLNWSHHVRAAAKKARCKAVEPGTQPGQPNPQTAHYRNMPAALAGLRPGPHAWHGCRPVRAPVHPQHRDKESIRADGVGAERVRANAPRARQAWDATPLVADVAVRATQRLMRCLNDTGRLGRAHTRTAACTTGQVWGRKTHARGGTTAAPPWLMRCATNLRRLRAGPQLGSVREEEPGGEPRPLERRNRRVARRSRPVANAPTPSPTRLHHALEAMAPALATLWHGGVRSFADLIGPTQQGSVARIGAGPPPQQGHARPHMRCGAHAGDASAQHGRPAGAPPPAGHEAQNRPSPGTAYRTGRAVGGPRSGPMHCKQPYGHTRTCLHTCRQRAPPRGHMG